MKTLIYTSSLGLLSMVLEMLNLRRFVLPVCVLGLAIILGLNLHDRGMNQVLYSGMLFIDGYSIAFSSILLLLTGLILILAGNFYKNEESKISDYLSILIFTLCGAIAMVSFGNLVMFFLGLEVLSISLYILAGSKKKDSKSNEAGMKYFLMGSFASGLLLMGIALVYAETGSFSVFQISHFTTTLASNILLQAGVGLILIALLFKVSAVPFHFWAPDVYEGSPTLITAFMATVAKIAAFGAFYRLFSTCFAGNMGLFAWVFSAVTALTITLGNFTALNQDSFKRMLAYSGIAHAGYMMLAIISVYGHTAGALFYYAVAYGLSSVAAFAISIVIARNTGSEKFDAFNGLGKRKPWLAGALTLTMLSLAGIPPFAGFFGKYYLFSEAIRNGHLWMVVLAVLNSIVGIFYYFKVIYAMYTKDGSEVPVDIKPSYAFVIGLCVLLLLLVGIFPSAVTGFGLAFK